MSLTVLYRGPLSSCNYGCPYCPFALRVESRDELERDRAALERFTAWVQARTDSTSVFFTPWGEALVRGWYRDAIRTLSNLAHVRRVAIQTNLSAPPRWTQGCNLETLALWATYHPGEVDRHVFVEHANDLLSRGVRFSVGVVGVRENFDEIAAIREALPKSVYVWVNAYRRKPAYYSDEDIAWLESIDPLFSINTRAYRSLGRGCRCGSDVISVDGDGRATRCHFIDASIGNIYEPGFIESLRDVPCSVATCRCHIGYVHMDDLGLDETFRDGVLERIPFEHHDRDRLIAAARRVGSLHASSSLIRRMA